MSTSSKVLLFGATGKVGGAATRFAVSRNVDVHIAVRDPSKSLGTDLDSHFSSKKDHVHKADLTDAASVEAAVKASGATTAFVYCQHKSMLDVFEALKRAGVTYLVLLSSYTLGTSAEASKKLDVNNLDMIQTFHYRAEGQVKELNFPAYTFVRPGSFASNCAMWWKREAVNGKIRLPYPEAGQGHIVDQDIGDVVGGLVATHNASTNPPAIVALIGPRNIKHKDVVAILTRVLGKPIEIVPIDPEEYRAGAIKAGLPAPLIGALMGYWASCTAETDDVKLSENVQKYAGHPATTFEQWAEKHAAAAFA